MPEHELTRRAMYDLVWSQPMIKVAESFGISDVALKKICDRHRVPTPARGYWAKKAAGKPAKQVPFHGTADPQHEHISIHGSHQNLPPEVKQALNEERQRRKALPKVTPPPIDVEPIPPIEDVHPSMAATARALRKAKPDRDNVVRANGPGCCGIEVGVTSAGRVITILDGLARALEVRELTIDLASGHMRVAVARDELTFSLVERIERRPHVPTMEELALEEQQKKKRERGLPVSLWSLDYKRVYPEFDFIRSGELSLQIANEYVGLRRNWTDGKRQRLENLTDDIAGGIVAYLAGIRAKREERERWQRSWERQRHLDALVRAREERETKRAKFLNRLAAISGEADQLRPFVAKLRCELTENDVGELTRLLEWADAYVSRLENELTPDGISEALGEQKLFPEPDPLVPPEMEED
ncbi:MULTISPECIES: hypothetical protein [unclassified Bradyrhizobium]|uniref:hypothetical protein n=2 Tax=unclassified Bradyrhizobium TaxID=2631580 RepID=UPI0028F13C91|nr:MULTISPECIES: hypothetical protein [unclassified Bradyrhizobium]